MRRNTLRGLRPTLANMMGDARVAPGVTTANGASDLPIVNLQPKDSVVTRSADALAATRSNKIIPINQLNVIQQGDTLTIVAHGSPTSVGGLSAQELAGVLKGGFKNEADEFNNGGVGRLI